MVLRQPNVPNARQALPSRQTLARLHLGVLPPVHAAPLQLWDEEVHDRFVRVGELDPGEIFEVKKLVRCGSGGKSGKETD